MTQNNDQNQFSIDLIQDALKSLKYGSIEVVVHAGRVTQIERRERVRFASDKA